MPNSLSRAHVGTIVRTVAISSALLLQPLLSTAADKRFPGGPVTIIVPFTAGGNSDSVTRLIAEKLGQEWKQTVIVDNKPGAGGVAATDFVAKSRGDGRTLAYAPSALTINPGLFKSLPYDTLKDLVGVIQLTTQPLAIVANPSVPFNTVRELIDYSKANPGKINYGSPGVGTGMHLAGELFKQKAGIDMQHVPYKGSGPAQIDLIGGRLDIVIDTLSFQLPAIQSGKVKLIAITSPARHEKFPNYATVSETLPGFSAASNTGIIASASTPPDIVAKLNKSIAQILHEPATAKRMTDLGLDIVASTPQQYSTTIKREIDVWTKVITDARITPE